MQIKNNFFNGYFYNSSKYNNNIKKTKKAFNSFLIDLKNFKIPLLQSYEKNYKFDFSKSMKKFTQFINFLSYKYSFEFEILDSILSHVLP